jgi:hypothetical protein
LPRCGEWFTDGPPLPIEFARISADQRVTLVTTTGVVPIPTLWTMLTSPNLDSAILSLAIREGITRKPDHQFIGYCDCKTNATHGRHAEEILAWAKSKELDAVVWTNLKAGTPSARTIAPLPLEKVLFHLRNLQGKQIDRAEEYIRKAPLQTNTYYRRCIEKELGWSPL